MCACIRIYPASPGWPNPLKRQTNRQKIYLLGYVEKRLWWPQQRKKEDSEKLKGERDQIEFIDLRLERWQVVRFRKARRRQDVP